MRLRLALAVPLTVLLTGCAAFRGPAGGGLESALPSETPLPQPTAFSGMTGAIPWIDVRPAGFHQGTAVPLGDGIPPQCKAPDLTAGYGGATAATNGQLEASVDFVNRSSSACSLLGMPVVRLLAGGDPIPITVWANTRFGSKPVVLPPRPFTPPDSLIGQQVGDAFVAIDWSLYDPGVGTCAKPIATATLISVELPAGGGVITTPATSPRSDGPLTFCPPRIGVGAFQPATNQFGASASPGIPQRYWVATLKSPAQVRPGDVLYYQVTVTNVFYRALTFPNGCPAYVEALAGPSDWTTGKEWYQLNCGPAGTIEPGASATFAMELKVPPAAPPGKSSLLWGLDSGSTNYGASTADLTITSG